MSLMRLRLNFSLWFCFFLFAFSVYGAAFELEKVVVGLSQPWSLSFKTASTILITEKEGVVLIYDFETKQLKKINHNLSVLEDGQGGLMDVLYHEGYVYVSFSEDRGKGKSSTSVGRALFNERYLSFQVIFRAEPAINSGYHFGSRLVVKDNYLYVTAGERGAGMIAQNTQKHPGSIIRIHLDGAIPVDNPRFIDKPDWLPELYQIGVRNPQGMALSPYDNVIYISNHGAMGGDWFGRIEKGGNYGWKILGWGGKNYSGLPIGPKWKVGYTKPLKYWVPSIAVSAIAIYKGNAFSAWNGTALITSLKDKSLRKIDFSDPNLIKEEIIFKNKIGRIRDIKIHPDSGNIFLLSDSGVLWQMN
ncbi:MAG: glucose dehydrogenase [Rickettsiales bacterium]|nr:glucose dehydrogenase [Rickettsiales bacterium]